MIAKEVLEAFKNVSDYYKTIPFLLIENVKVFGKL
jgi:hypothetical protein